MAEPLTPSEQETLRRLEEQLLAETPELARAFAPLSADRPAHRRWIPCPAWVLLTAGVVFVSAGWILEVRSAVAAGLVLLVCGDLAAWDGHSLSRLIWAGLQKWRAALQ